MTLFTAKYGDTTGEKFDVTDELAALIAQHNITFVERVSE